MLNAVNPLPAMAIMNLITRPASNRIVLDEMSRAFANFCKFTYVFHLD